MFTLFAIPWWNLDPGPSNSNLVVQYNALDCLANGPAYLPQTIWVTTAVYDETLTCLFMEQTNWQHFFISFTVILFCAITEAKSPCLDSFKHLQYIEY